MRTEQEGKQAITELNNMIAMCQYVLDAQPKAYDRRSRQNARDSITLYQGKIDSIKYMLGEEELF